MKICQNCSQNLEERDGRLWARVGGFKCIPPFGRQVKEAHELRKRHRCKVCKGSIRKGGVTTEGWLHLYDEDWQDSPHNVEPEEMIDADTDD